MKSKLAILFAISGLLFAAACKKKVETCKPGRAYVTDGTTTPNPTIYAFNGERLSRVNYPNGDFDSLVYNNDTMWVFTFDNRDSLTTLLHAITDGNGNVTTATQTTYNYFGQPTGIDNINCTYNAEGNLTQQTISNSTGTTIYTYNFNNGNRISGSKFVGAVKTETYSFFAGTVDNKGGINDLTNLYTPYLGKPSYKLLDSAWTITNTDTIRIRYEHTLDANDYVSKTVKTYLSPGFQTKYYTYSYFDCK